MLAQIALASGSMCISASSKSMPAELGGARPVQHVGNVLAGCAEVGGSQSMSATPKAMPWICNAHLAAETMPRGPNESTTKV